MLKENKTKTFGPFSWSKLLHNKLTFKYTTNLTEKENSTINSNNYLVFELFKFRLVITLPPIIKTKKVELRYLNDKEKTVTIYLDKKYGFGVSTYSYQFHYGLTEPSMLINFLYDTSEIKRKVIAGFLPWSLQTQTKHVYLNNIGNIEIDFAHPKNKNIRPSNYPVNFNNTRTFAFKKNEDDEELYANVRMEYREWRFGVGYFKWLHYFNNPSKEKRIIIAYYEDGYYECVFVMKNDETSLYSFKRWCDANHYTFLEELPFREML